jgi:hypothetical protein
MAKVVIGIFEDYGLAAQAVEQLKAAAFNADDISLVGRSRTEMRPVVSEVVSNKPDKLMTDLGIAGAIGGLLIGLATIVIPGAGALMVAGPLVAAISGAAAGGAIGVVTGALVHFDVPEADARIYEGHLSSGKVLVAVHTEDPERRVKAEEILDSNGAIEIDTKAA